MKVSDTVQKTANAASNKINDVLNATIEEQCTTTTDAMIALISTLNTLMKQVRAKDPNLANRMRGFIINSVEGM